MTPRRAKAAPVDAPAAEALAPEAAAGYSE
jgi:hypothetical protein